MFNLDHIAAVVDFRQPKHFALPRALELARLFNCKITLLSNTYESFMDFIPSGSSVDRQLIKDEAIQQNRDNLEKLVKQFDSSGVEINYQTLWSKSLHSGLCEYINENKFDLVVKTAHAHSSLQKLLSTPTDWSLLRDTKTNILFVKKGSWPSKTSILGAINIEDDDAHRELNNKIISTTVELANVCHSKSNILNVFPWPMVKFEKFNHLFKNKDLFLEIKKKHTKSVNDFVKGVSTISGKVIVAEGLEAEETIPEITKSTHSDLLVMGTVGRKGVQAAVIGNTAEKILDVLECEVLALK